jgi:hypothetical protein
VAAEDAAGVLGAIGGRGLVVAVRDAADVGAAAAGGSAAVTGPTGPTS